MEYAIVGFDPGVTSGVAIISLEGALVFSESFRNNRLEDIAGAISSRCTPVIVATDVSPPSDSSARLARMFGATLFYPTISLTVAEKQSMISHFKVKDVHQRDALASAISAHRSYRPMMEKIKQKSGEKYGMVLEKILKGEASKIDDALLEKVKVVMPGKPSSLKARLETLKLNRDSLQERVEYLTQVNRESNARLKEARRELERVRTSTYTQVAADRKVKALVVQLHNMQKNDLLLFQRAKLAEERLEAVENWLSTRTGILLQVAKEGEGLRVGEYVLVEDVRDMLERLIKEHRKRK